ncbi:hypothetical protein BDB00DRAFT_761904 [Zychaea mexicana]|uniref:uncharacterized protein n=1 Tax=Zychaea mexicana TaxID=64656 RepID=UPI0022FE03BE|nr:uncharacterized protein BDB00DRAFT_761904 [Zychaea mexicana]KAI9494454.1 hypothetical protein BDB00DRAFT_761904 [Zychaea mexicana]
MAIGSTKKCIVPGIKLAPPIQHAVIIDEKLLDQKTYFSIQVIPQQTDIRIVNGSPVGKRSAPAARQPYTIARRYEDFSHFAQRLREAFPTTTRSLASRAGSRLLSSPLENTTNNRRSELDKFMQALFRLPPSISQSLVVLEFFGLQKADTEQQILRQQQQQDDITTSRLLRSQSSMTQHRDSQSTCATSVAPSPTTSPTLRLIKIKVIYDVDNIIVIQVPRSITLTDLRARIAQKFSDPSISLPKDFVLLFNDTRSSASSSTSAASSFSVDSTSGTATLIAKEQDLANAMGSAWVRHEKVTLRCVA